MAGGAALLGLDVPLGSEIVNDDDVSGPAYGVSNNASRAALAIAARADALLLDPVYTAKGFAGLLRWIRDARVGRGESVLFLHTGGLPALFAYGDELGGHDYRGAM
jgi:1-aminocyclopropane-1-carboxylate deaminase/D-cysteine desulfhydrase-like pyridoxal-dependent ACC family enzyme